MCKVNNPTQSSHVHPNPNTLSLVRDSHDAHQSNHHSYIESKIRRSPACPPLVPRRPSTQGAPRSPDQGRSVSGARATLLRRGRVLMADCGALPATRKRYDKTVLGIKRPAPRPTRCHRAYRRAAEAYQRPATPPGQPLDGMPPANIARAVAESPFKGSPVAAPTSPDSARTGWSRPRSRTRHPDRPAQNRLPPRWTQNSRREVVAHRTCDAHVRGRDEVGSAR